MSTDPTPDMIYVACDSLDAAATKWFEASDRMADGIPIIQSVRLSNIQLGIYQDISESYKKIVDLAELLFGEGSDQLHSVADTLKSVAATYRDEEARGVHALEKLY